MQRRDFKKVYLKIERSVLAKYAEVEHAYENLYLVKNRETNLFGLINISLEEVLPCAYQKEELKQMIREKKDQLENYEFKERKIYKKDGMVGYTDSNNQLIIPLDYEKGFPFTENLACVRQEGSWGYIDKNNFKKISFQYEMAFPFREGLAPVKFGGKWGFINQDNQFVIDPIYDKVDTFRFGYALVKKGEEYFFVDKEGKKVTTKFLETRFIENEGDLPKNTISFETIEYLSIIELSDQTVLVREKDPVKYIEAVLEVEKFALLDSPLLSSGKTLKK